MATVRTLAASDDPFARFDRPPAASPTTLAVLSDLHVSVDAHGTWKMFHRTRRRVRETLADVERRDVDALVVSGDLTKDGAERDLDWVASALDAASVPTLAVPGNHDLAEVDASAFAETLARPLHLERGDRGPQRRTASRPPAGGRACRFRGRRPADPPAVAGRTLSIRRGATPRSRGFGTSRDRLH